MLNTNIVNHLSQTTPPAMYDLLERSIVLMESFGFDHLQEDLEEIIASTDGAMDSGELSTNSVYQYLSDSATTLLSQHAIELSEEAMIPVKLHLLQFIKDVEKTELIVFCRDMLASDEFDNADKLLNCIEAVCGIDPIEIQDYLLPLPDSVIRTLHEYFDKRCLFEEEVEPLPENLGIIYRDFSHFIRSTQGETMACAQYVFEIGGAVNMPLEHYVDQYKDYLFALSPENLSLELIGFCILSEDGIANPVKTIMQNVEKYITDLNVLTKLEMTVHLDINQYRNELSSGVTRQ